MYQDVVFIKEVSIPTPSISIIRGVFNFNIVANWSDAIWRDGICEEVLP